MITPTLTCWISLSTPSTRIGARWTQPRPCSACWVRVRIRFEFQQCFTVSQEKKKKKLSIAHFCYAHVFCHPTSASVGVTFGATAIIHTVLVCTLLVATRKNSVGDPYFVTYVFWTTFFFFFLVFFLGVCVRMTIAHANVLLELRRHGTRRLLQARGFRCMQ